MKFVAASAVPSKCSAMGDRIRSMHCDEYTRSISRMCEVIEREGMKNEPARAIVAEVSKVLQGFQVLGRIYGDQLMRRVQEVRNLEKEKESLERKLHRLGMPPEVSSRSSGRPAGLEGDSHRLELQLAELRSAYTARTLDSRNWHNQTLNLESKLRKLQGSSVANEDARFEPSKARAEEISDLRKAHAYEVSRLRKTHADEMFKARVEQLRVHTEDMSNMEKARLEEVSNLRAEMDRIRSEEVSNMKTEMGRMRKALEEVQNQARTSGEEVRQERERNQVLADDLRLQVETNMQLEATNQQLEEELRRETVRNAQLVELWKKESEEQEESKRQYRTLKAYLRCLGTKYPGDLHIELKVLERMDLEEDILSSLKLILERSICKSSAGQSKPVTHSGNAGLRGGIEVLNLDDD